jgi:hypothetical protein
MYSLYQVKMQAIEEESEDSDLANNDDLDPETAELKERKVQQKEELRHLRTRMLSIKEQLTEKTNKIDNMREKFKASRPDFGSGLDLETSNNQEIDRALIELKIDQELNDREDEENSGSEEEAAMNDDEDEDYGLEDGFMAES